LHNTKYRPDIDGLRAIAIISVVLFHSFPEIFPGGFIGVDIFFVISGYLISSIILNGLNQGNFSFKEFYSKRVKRIFPALITTLFLVLVAAWFTLLSDDYRSLGNHTWRGGAFISNFLLWRESGYFDTAAETKPLLHLWSLSIEEQFYLIWPISVWLMWHLKKSWLLPITAIIFMISFAFNVLLIEKESIADFYNPLTRFWELLFGTLLAYYITLKNISPNQARSLNKHIPPVIGVLLLLIGLAMINKARSFPGWWALLPTLGASLLIFSNPQSWVNKNILSNRLLVWFGLISFPLYLWHWPLFAFARIFYGPKPPSMVLLSLIGVSILLAWGTYQFIEKPIRHGNQNPLITKKLAVGLALVGISGLTIFKLDGISSRFNSDEQSIASLQWKASYNNTDACKSRYPSEQYCLLSNDDKNPTAAIIGDSHANHFFWGLSEFYKAKGGNLINMGYGACGPFMGLDRSEIGPNGYLNCYKKMRPIFDAIEQDKNIKTVFLAFHHDEYFYPNAKLVDVIGELSNIAQEDLLLASLKKTIRTLSNSGKEVVLIYDLPNLYVDTGTHLKKCFYANLLHINTGCNQEEIQFHDDLIKYKAIVEQLKKETDVKVFDTQKYVSGNFPINAQNEWTYRDYQHLTMKGSLFFTDKYRW